LQLVGGVAVIKVAQPPNRTEGKKARVEDAMHATRGCRGRHRPGGGSALLRCIAAVEKLKLHDDEAVGAGIVRRALEEPSARSLSTRPRRRRCDRQDRDSKEENFGFNAETGEYGDM